MDHRPDYMGGGAQPPGERDATAHAELEAIRDACPAWAAAHRQDHGRHRGAMAQPPGGSSTPDGHRPPAPYPPARPHRAAGMPTAQTTSPARAKVTREAALEAALAAFVLPEAVSRSNLQRLV